MIQGVVVEVRVLEVAVIPLVMVSSRPRFVGVIDDVLGLALERAAEIS
jgi:hypothetical protein